MGNIFKKSRKSGMSYKGHTSANERLSSFERCKGDGGQGADGYAAHDSSVKQFPRTHNEAVMSVVIAKGLCLSGGQESILALTDPLTGSVVQRWSGHHKEITKVLYAPTSDTYFSSSRDRCVNVWQRGRDGPVRSFIGHDLVVAGITLNHSNTVLCTGSRDNSVRLWDVSTSRCIKQASLAQNLVTDVKWSHGGSDLIAQSSEDKQLRLWSAQSLEVFGSFPQKQYIQTSCDVSADNRYCLSSSNGFGGNGCESTLWDVRMMRMVHEFKGHYETVCCCRFVPAELTNGRNLIITSSNDCSVRVWDRDSGECVSITNISGSGPLTSIAIDENQFVYVASFNIGIQKFKLQQSQTGVVTLERRAEF